MEEQQAPHVPPVVPAMTIERFSHLTGLSIDTVYGHIKRGYIPSMKMGRYRLVNIALLQLQCLQAEDYE